VLFATDNDDMLVDGPLIAQRV